MNLCTASQIRDLDKQTIAAETLGAVLMERAGEQLCHVIVQQFADVAGKHISIVAGGGNNGGDGFVAARLLHELQAKVRVVLLVSPGSIAGDALVNFDLLHDIAVTVVTDESEARSVPLQCDLLVDSLLGTGLTRDVSGRFAIIIERMNRSGVAIIAVDIPSGIDADTGQLLGCAVKADVTVTFQLQKQGMVQYPGIEYVGDVVVADIGISPERIASYNLPFLLTSSVIAKIFPVRSASGHKGSFGHGLIVAGSKGKTGAAVLCGLGCLRSGAGLVSLCVPERLNTIFETHLLEAMTIPVQGEDGICFGNGDFNDILLASRGKGCVVIGPGLGLKDTTAQLVQQLVRELASPMLIDADGLNLLDMSILAGGTGKEIVLTPHPGEMARLSGKSVAEVQGDRVGAATFMARKYNVTVVLKGAGTVIAGSGGQVAINSTGNAGMGAGGMGDVLSGIISGFIASGMSGFDAACLGVYGHGRAGDLLVENGLAFGYLASELADTLPEVWHELQIF
ncbi:MAG: NAD(P)H-hydrate dehydratase [Desulfobulbaceae bacterium]|jgi:hydroxyethylthiazole kinase-like uncharacterized protein yjeF|nr:NAD(P)H-hydrate dehydratase [Desulfobulbaceae bacterium]